MAVPRAPYRDSGLVQYLFRDMKPQSVNAAIFKVIDIQFQTIRFRSKLQEGRCFPPRQSARIWTGR